MILHNKKFEEFIKKVIEIQMLGVDIAIYMENAEVNSVNLYIANNLNRATYNIKYAAITNTTWRIVEGRRICESFNSEKYKLDAERVKELYGVDDDEMESDYTIEDLELKALPRTAKVILGVLEERMLERIASGKYSEEKTYNIFWQSNMIGVFLPNKENYEDDCIKMLQSDLDRR